MNKDVEKALIEFSENVEKELKNLKLKLEEEQKKCLEELKRLWQKKGE